MAKQTISKKTLIDALSKKATGFYYDEVQCEYQKVQNKPKNNEHYANNINNLNFFEIIDRGITDNQNASDIIKVSNKNEKVLDNNNLELVRKKVISHYNPPDLAAIKILFEIIETEEDTNSINNLSDQELLNLRDKLFEEIKNETNKNK